MNRHVVAFLTAALAALASCTPTNSPSSGTLQTPVVYTQQQAPFATLPVAPPSDCPHMPLGGFDTVWRDPQVWPRLGCAVRPAEAVTGTEAFLSCLHSIWLREKRQFVALDYGSHWTFIRDESGLSADAPLMVEPVPRRQPDFPSTGRHGWLSREKCDGQSSTSETTFSGALQPFERGWLLWNGNVCLVLFSDGTWTMF